MSTLTNGVNNNEILTISSNTDTTITICVYEEVEESEDQIVELACMFFDLSLDDTLAIMGNNPNHKRRYYADFKTTALFNRFVLNSDLHHVLEALQLIH